MLENLYPFHYPFSTSKPNINIDKDFCVSCSIFHVFLCMNCLKLEIKDSYIFSIFLIRFKGKETRIALALILISYLIIMFLWKGCSWSLRSLNNQMNTCPRNGMRHTWINNKRIRCLMLFPKYIQYNVAHVTGMDLTLRGNEIYKYWKEKVKWISVCFTLMWLRSEIAKEPLLQLDELYLERMKGYPAQFITFSWFSCCLFDNNVGVAL